jgi:hypothetical protein
MCYLPSHTVNGQACIAYCFVTIPSVDAILSRLNLSLISGRVAIANGALSQGDAFFKSAINLLKEVPQYMDLDSKRISTESFMSCFLCNFFSTLLVVPVSWSRDSHMIVT